MPVVLVLQIAPLLMILLLEQVNGGHTHHQLQVMDLPPNHQTKV